MKALYRGTFFTLALTLAGIAAAQVPSTNDTSDGHGNTGSGYSALVAGSTGYSNSAFGTVALASINGGSYNTASGAFALELDQNGSQNVATGFQSLDQNSSGNYNTASGAYALYSNTTGSSNIAVGNSAGIYLTTGSNNIDIGNVGVAGESNLIRIGTKGTHKGAIIAGISTSKVTGSAVYVTTTGRLGVLASSERYKVAITPMGSNTVNLQHLRPVTFHLKSDPNGALQYGLIAEEVAKVYPELVIRGDKGRIEGVRYDELAPMLLNEVQQERAKVTAQADQLQDMQRQLSEMHETLTKLQARDQLVAGR